MTEELTIQDLINQGKQIENGIDFDLSAIFVGLNDPLFDAIINYSQNQLNGIGFNYDTLYQWHNKRIKQSHSRSPQKPHPPIQMERSIQQNCDDIESCLMGVLSRILPSTESLSYLSLRHIPLLYPEIDVLSQSLSQCSSIRVLAIEDVPLKLKGFKRLSKALHNRAVICLRMKNCELDDSIADELLSLIHFHVKIQTDAQKKADFEHHPCEVVSIVDYDFRENNFTSSFVQMLEADIQQSPIVRFDLRGNSKINSNVVTSPKIFIGPLSYEINSKTKNQSSTTLQHQLEDENSALHAELNRLTDGKYVAFISKNLFAIGDRAPELVDHINALDSFCEDLQNESINSISNPPPTKSQYPKKPRYLKQKKRASIVNE